MKTHLKSRVFSIVSVIALFDVGLLVTSPLVLATPQIKYAQNTSDVKWNEFNVKIKSTDFENSIPHMYLDSVGAVTVGVGNKLSSVADTQKLTFINRQTKKAATPQEIKSDFESVKNQSKGLRAAAYEQYTKLYLPEAAIDELLNTRITETKNALKRNFPKYESYPLTVQFALVDMAFNLGITGLIQKFPTFKKAIESEKWKEAANESNRPQLSASRNSTVKKWLEEARN